MNGKLVKGIYTKEYHIELRHNDNGKYVIVYMIDNNEAESEEIDIFEMATVMFDLKLQQLRDAVPVRYVS